MTLNELFNIISGSKRAQHLNLISLVKEYLKNDTNHLEAKNERGYTLLHESVEIGDLNLATYLLKKGAQVDSLDIAHQTPLMIASFNGHFDIMKLLLEKGANPNAQSYDHKTALMIIANKDSISKSEEEVIDLLLSYKADIELKNLHGQKFIDFILRQNKISLIEYFIFKGLTMGLKEIDWIEVRKYLPENKIFDLLEEYYCPISMPSPSESLYHTYKGIKKSFIDYCHIHNKRINEKSKEIPIQLAQQTPLLDTLSTLIGQYVTAHPSFQNSFQEYFHKARALCMSPNYPNPAPTLLGPCPVDILQPKKRKLVF